VEPSSIGDEAREVGKFFRAGTLQYGMKIADVWDERQALSLTHRPKDENGSAWVRTQLSRLETGGITVKGGGKCGVSYSVQCDLFRLIHYSEAAGKWRKRNGVQNDKWLNEAASLPALANLLLKSHPAALIDPGTVNALASAIIEDIGPENISTRRRSAAIDAVSLSLRKRASDMAWRANIIWVRDYGDDMAAVAGSEAPDTMLRSILGSLTTKLWPE